ncbi:MAG TPA: GGDEF domain-containing protein, partial [Alphaproteobacteria bacterium]|nr:GGDEF domain-containing protein [Alphaproteobacteria bacterium]
MPRYSRSLVSQVKPESLPLMPPGGEVRFEDAAALAKLGNIDSALAALAQAENVIEAQRKRIAHLETLVLMDEVTGLMNRCGFMTALQRELATARRDQQAYGVVLMFDIDRFKQVNEVHGHGAGDAYLAAFGAALVAELRSTDIVARLGEDEFGALL